MNECFNNSQSKERKYEYPMYNEMGSPHYMIKFSGLSEKYCVGFIDIVNSTIISANMNEIGGADIMKTF